MPVPNIFAGQSGTLRLIDLDANFAAVLATSQDTSTQFTHFFARATATAAFILSDNQLTIGNDGTLATKDAGAIRGFCTLTSTTANGLPRAIEAQTSIPTGATFVGAFGMEIGLHSQVPGTGSAVNPTSIGLYLLSSHTGWLASGVRNDCGIFIGGEDGWVTPILCLDTDFATTLFRVSQTGSVFAKTNVLIGMADDSSGAALQISGFSRVGAGTAITAGGTANSSIRLGPTGGAIGIFWGSGVPTVTGTQGSLYLRSDGSSTSTRLYVNTGAGWTSVTTAT